MNAFSKTGLLALCLLAAGLLTGCSSGTGGNAAYVDSSGPRTVVSLEKINIQDWNNAADKMVQSLLNSTVLDKAPQQPTVMAISRIVNSTSEQIDTDMLTKKIRVALSQSGKVVTTTTFGKNAEDALAKEAGDAAAFMQGEQAPNRIPYYTLSGKILEDYAKAGNTRQRTYIFQLSLTEVKTGLAVWEDEVSITKQGKRNAIGW